MTKTQYTYTYNNRKPENEHNRQIQIQKILGNNIMENPSDDCNNTMGMGMAVMEEINAIPDIEKERPQIGSIEKECSSDSQLILESIMSSTEEKYGRRGRCLTKDDNDDGANNQKRRMDNLNLVEILVTPTDSEALELELASTTTGKRRQGISASETMVTSSPPPSICKGNNNIIIGSHQDRHNKKGEGSSSSSSSCLIFDDGTSTSSSSSILCPPSPTSSSSLNGFNHNLPHHHTQFVMSRAMKASMRGESIPKSLVQHTSSRKSLSSSSSGSSTTVSPPQQQQTRIYINNSPYSNPSTLLGVIQEEDEEE